MPIQNVPIQENGTIIGLRKAIYNYSNPVSIYVVMPEQNIAAEQIFIAESLAFVDLPWVESTAIVEGLLPTDSFSRVEAAVVTN